MRHGRSELFTWCPTQQEKFDVVKTMLLDVCGKDSIVWSLIKSFSDQPISFFSSLRSDAVDQILAKYDCRKLLEQHRDEIQRIIDSELGHGDGRMLLELANQRSTRITTNFLNTEIDS